MLFSRDYLLLDRNLGLFINYVLHNLTFSEIYIILMGVFHEFRHAKNDFYNTPIHPVKVLLRFFERTPNPPPTSSEDYLLFFNKIRFFIFFSSIELQPPTSHHI